MDGQIHVFAQENNDQDHFVESNNLATVFPIINRINDRRIRFVNNIASYIYIYTMMKQFLTYKYRILYMHIYDQPNGEKVICAGGQDGDIILAFYDKGINCLP